MYGPYNIIIIIITVDFGGAPSVTRGPKRATMTQTRSTPGTRTSWCNVSFIPQTLIGVDPSVGPDSGATVWRKPGRREPSAHAPVHARCMRARLWPLLYSNAADLGVFAHAGQSMPNVGILGAQAGLLTPHISPDECQSLHRRGMYSHSADWRGTH